jgi:tetratricopeptide (TPR) repeat protein
MSLAKASAALLNLGAAHYTAGRFDQAQIVYRAILKVRPDHADSLHMLGVMAYKQGRNGEAIELIAQALRLNSSRSDYASNLGNALQQDMRLADAEICYRAAIVSNPKSAPAYNNLGAVLRAMGRSEESIAACETALSLRPGYGDAHNNLAIALADVSRFEDSAAHCEAALSQDPSRTETRNNLGNVLAHLGRFDAAVAQYDLALADTATATAGAAEIRHNLGMTLLRAGRFEEGWREYEHRWQARQLSPNRRTFAEPQWDGAPLGERTLLIHAEQGFGDTLQFCRYAARIPGRVILEVQPALAPLLAGQLGAHAVIAAGDPLPDFDVHCAMMSLPGLIEPRPDPVANAAPYLHADPGRQAVWAARVAPLPGLRVGLVWAGGHRPNQPSLAPVNRRRSTQLQVLAPLLATPGVSFVSLQKGAPAEELAGLAEGVVVHDFTTELDDFADTAALTATLDLVISVDTAVAHLAGALGKPVWLLNRYDSCWRWLAGRDDSPWYPTLTQYRQTTPGDWSAPVEAMAADLLRRAAQP